MSGRADLLRDLVRAKAVFQQRTLELLLRERPAAPSKAQSKTSAPSTGGDQ